MWRKPEISSERQVSSRLRGTSSHLLLRTAADNCCRRSHRAKRAPERLAARGQAIARSRGARLPLGELLGELPASSSPVQPSPTQPNPAQPSPRGARTYRQQRAQHHRPAGARGRDLRAPLSAAAPLRRRAATAAAWENGYFMNGRAARPSAHARPRGSMNGWAPGRQCACSPPFYEWGRRGARGGRARPWPRCGLLL